MILYGSLSRFQKAPPTRFARFAQVGHNKLHIVENTGSFEDKMVRTTQAVCESLGVPSPSIKPRWWIVEIDPALNGVPPLDVEHVECVLEHTFLKTMNNHIESRVTRKRENQREFSAL